MSVLDSIANSILKYQQEQSHDRYPYLVKEGQDWVLKRNMNGCRPVKVQASILMDKSPAPLPGALATSARTTPSHPPEGRRVVTDTSNTKDSKAQTPEGCPVPPPPFDMLDIPVGMKHMGFKYASYLVQRWFNGRAHIAPVDRGAIFPKEFIDTGSLKLSWVLGFGEVRQRYEHLLANNLATTASENIFNQKARENLTRKFQQFMVQQRHQFSGVLDTLTTCAGDLQVLHQQFQFQLANISLADVLGRPTMMMNDLAASLANFGLFAAVATAKISNARYSRYDIEPWRKCSHARVEITHIYVYAKDSYSFNDNFGSGISQYLGHWNRHGVIIAANAALAELFSKVTSPQYHYESGNEPRMYLPPVPQHLDMPVDSGNRWRESEVFYPVRNQHFQSWRELKKRGGDFLIYSNLERVKLAEPIKLDLGEACWK